MNAVAGKNFFKYFASKQALQFKCFHGKFRCLFKYLFSMQGLILTTRLIKQLVANR